MFKAFLTASKQILQLINAKFKISKNNKQHENEHALIMSKN